MYPALSGHFRPRILLSANRSPVRPDWAVVRMFHPLRLVTATPAESRLDQHHALCAGVVGHDDTVEGPQTRPVSDRHLGRRSLSNSLEVAYSYLSFVGGACWLRRKLAVLHCRDCWVGTGRSGESALWTTTGHMP